MTNNPILNALSASAYVALVASFMYYGPKFAEGADNVVVPMAMLSLLVLSVSIMGFLFFYRPMRIYLDGDKDGAVKFFLKTVATFFIITASFFGFLFSGKGDLGIKKYESEKLHLSFSYPDHYFLEEKDLSDGHRFRYALVLTEDTKENRDVREGRSLGREGPVSITIEVFQNDLDNTTTENWIRGTSYSNFKLSPDGVISKTSISGKEALGYRWSGLYEGKTVAVATHDFVYSFSVTRMTFEDRIIKDFESVLSSASLK